jgi:Domain of unknown function (DUF4159)
MFKGAAVALLVLFIGGIALSEIPVRKSLDSRGDTPGVEFRMARVKYKTFGGAGSHGIIQPWWAIDYPYAEEHFLAALSRVTEMDVFKDDPFSDHIELSDPRIFQYPFLFLQQPGQGRWRPTPQEATNLREHLTRGGFMLIDDIHGEYDWRVLETALKTVFPDRKIVDIPVTDPLMHIFYDLEQGVPIPGLRHLWRGRGGQIEVEMEGTPTWRAIYDDKGRIMLAINFNMDMGDAWEHADDPQYPSPMTALAYKLGTNYVIYSMTH